MYGPCPIVVVLLAYAISIGCLMAYTVPFDITVDLSLSSFQVKGHDASSMHDAITAASTHAPMPAALLHPP